MCCYLYLKDMVDLIYSNESLVDVEFNKVFCKIVGFSVKNVFCSLGKGYFFFLCESEFVLLEVCKYEKCVNSIFVKLVLFVDLLFVVLGGDFKKVEFLLVCLGDVMSYLYGVMVVICFYE